MTNLYTLAEYLERIEKAHIKNIDMGLSRVRQVFEALSLDFSELCVVTVAGTNGKGTTCRFIEQACLNSHLRVGVYSSPHIERFNERIRINAQEASDETLCKAFAMIEDCARTANNGKPVSLTYFEYATLCALVIFAESKLDIGILEVGLGGRLDATNIIDADIGVITSIGLDHQDYLGNTLEQIADEKAGIVKPAQQVVIGYDNAQSNLLDIVALHSSRSLVCGKDFGQNSASDQEKGWCNYALFSEACEENAQAYDTSHYEFDLSQANIPQQNVMTAIACLSFIADYFSVSGRDTSKNLSSPAFLQNIIPSVFMHGRFETINSRPYTVLDVAHNVQACELLVSRLTRLQHDIDNRKNSPNVPSQCHIIIGMLKDKNIEDCIEVLGQLAPRWYCVDLPSERGEKAKRLHDFIHTNVDCSPAVNNNKKSPKATENNAVNSFADVKDAFVQAKNNATLNDVILVVGSFILASEFMLINSVSKEDDS